MKKIPFFYHVPKNAGTYVVAYMLRISRILCKNIYQSDEKFRCILIMDQQQILARVIVFDKDNLCGQSLTKTPHANPILYSSSIDQLEFIVSASEVFGAIIESAGFICHDRISKAFEQKYSLLKFLIERDPLARQQSIYKYIISQKSHHEHTHGNFTAEISFADYLKNHVKEEDSWLIRHLLNIRHPQEITEEHFQSAFNILKNFLVDDIKQTDSLLRKVFLMSHDIDINDYPNIAKSINKNSNASKQVVVSDYSLVDNRLYWAYKLYSHLIF